MKIAYIAAGAAGMYCGSCLHDNTLAAALLDLGEDVVLVPTYTPLRTDERDVSIRRVFFGGINVYLQQRWRIFRHTPWWLDRWLDHPRLLDTLSKRGSSIDPTSLGDMTVSMLAGEAGHQRKELEKLVHWLLADIQPDVIHLSNSMQIGMARLLAERCGPPVVCQLSGEDLFLEKLVPPYYNQARELLRERARDVHAFVAINRYYADFMADYLAVDRDKVHVVPHGLKLDGHGKRIGARRGSPDSRVVRGSPDPGVVRGSPDPAQPLAIGYLARICEDKGLHLLIEACEQLATRDGVPPFVVRAAGYLGAADRPYLAALEQRAAAGPLAGKFTYLGELNRDEKITFLQSLDMMSVPTVYRESKGLPALEALANAVPVVLPNHGGFSELVADTGGGLLCRPHDPADLADKLAELLTDPVRATALGLAGQQAIEDRYHAEAMARQTLDLYRRLTTTRS